MPSHLPDIPTALAEKTNRLYQQRHSRPESGSYDFHHVKMCVGYCSEGLLGAVPCKSHSTTFSGRPIECEEQLDLPNRPDLTEKVILHVLPIYRSSESEVRVESRELERISAIAEDDRLIHSRRFLQRNQHAPKVSNSHETAAHHGCVAHLKITMSTRDS
ncbi:hypothetical protein TWF281_001869 [Arthrobotrys megalospora]